MLNCKTNWWKLVNLTWNIVTYQGELGDTFLGIAPGLFRVEIHALTTALLRHECSSEIQAKIQT